MASSRYSPAAVSSLSRATACSPPRRAVVIGAGIAGLAAAQALQSASFKVVVLESRDRIGGRVWTDDSLGFPVDLGAGWLHGVSGENPLAPLVRTLQMPMYRTSGDGSILIDHDLECYRLYDSGRPVAKAVVERAAVVFKRILEEANSLRDTLPPDSDMSLGEAMRCVVSDCKELQLQGIHHRVLQWFVCRLEGWFATDADRLSLRNWDQEEILKGGHGLMVKTYRPAIKALSSGLDILLSHRVREIKRWGTAPSTHGGPTTATSTTTAVPESGGALPGMPGWRLFSGGVQVTCENGAVLMADVAVVAVPLGVLQERVVHFLPALPEWKERGINSLGVGYENKIALLFREPFWPNVDFLGHVAPTPYGCSYFLNLHKATKQPLLVYMPAGRLAADLEALPDTEVISFAMAQLRDMLPTKAANSITEPVKWAVTRWHSDPHSLGAYSYDQVGGAMEDFDSLGASVEGRLFFAGEATSRRFPGTVHGAYASGIRAAQEAVKALDHLSASAPPLEVVEPPVMSFEEELGPGLAAAMLQAMPASSSNGSTTLPLLISRL